MRSGKPVPLLLVNVGLIQDTAEGANGNFGLPRYDCCVGGFAEAANELDVTPLPAGFGRVEA